MIWRKKVVKPNKDLLETRAAKQLRRYAAQIIELELLQQAAGEEMPEKEKNLLDLCCCSA